jgi:hypothetical protein
LSFRGRDYNNLAEQIMATPWTGFGETNFVTPQHLPEALRCRDARRFTIRNRPSAVGHPIHPHSLVIEFWSRKTSKIGPLHDIFRDQNPIKV